jgi:hypothetical protein
LRRFPCTSFRVAELQREQEEAARDGEEEPEDPVSPHSAAGKQSKPKATLAPYQLKDYTAREVLLPGKPQPPPPSSAKQESVRKTIPGLGISFDELQ